eukprot:1370742-Pyramimonas_sp.AAC.1
MQDLAVVANAFGLAVEAGALGPHPCSGRDLLAQPSGRPEANPDVDLHALIISQEGKTHTDTIY